jgi:hypothetical protein
MTTPTWYSGLLGQIRQDGVDVETSGGLNFITPLTVTPNESTKMIDVEVDASAIAFSTVQENGVDQPTRAKLNFLGFEITDDVGNDRLNVAIGAPAVDGEIAVYDTTTSKWTSTRTLPSSYTITGDLTLSDGGDTSQLKWVTSAGTRIALRLGSNQLVLGEGNVAQATAIASSVFQFSSGELIGDVYATISPSLGLLTKNDIGVKGTTSTSVVMNVAKIDSGNLLRIGENTAGLAGVSFYVPSGSSFDWQVAGASEMTLSGTALTLPTNYLGLGAAPLATIGTALRLAKQSSAYVRNFGGTADIRVFEHGADDRLYLGDHVNTVDVVMRTAGSFLFQQGATPTTSLSLGNTNADFTTLNVVTTGNISLGVGSKIRFGATPIDAMFVDGSDNLLIGKSGANGVTAIGYDVKTGGSHIFRVAGTDEATLDGTNLTIPTNNIVLGATPATLGTLRLTLAQLVRYGTSNYRALSVDGSGNEFIGTDDTGTGTDVVNLVIGAASGGAIQMRIAGTQVVGVASQTINFYAGSNTNLAMYGNSVAMLGFNIAASSVRNLEFFGAGSGAMNSMDRGVRVVDANAAPTADPSGALYWYSVGGRFALRGSSGNGDIDSPKSGSLVRLYTNATVRASFGANWFIANDGSGAPASLDKGIFWTNGTAPSANPSGGIALWSHGAGYLSVLAPSGFKNTIASNGGTAFRDKASATVTTTAGQTNITLVNYGLADKTSARVWCLIVARDQTNGDSASFVRTASFERTGATCALVGAITSVATDREDATWAVDLVADGSTGLNVRATATDASNSVKWDVYIEVLNSTVSAN